MKKLMIAVAVAMLGIAANAAKANWSGSAVTVTGADTAPATWSVILMDSAVTSQSDLTKLFAGTDKAKLAKAISDATVLTTAGTAVGSPATAGRWSVSGANLPAGYVDGAEVTFYTLILDNGGLQDAGNYFLTSDKPGTVSDNTALGMTFGSQTGKSWTSYNVVPEPTSGLLLLLGVAGLALRRRRA